MQYVKRLTKSPGVGHGAHENSLSSDSVSSRLFAGARSRIVRGPQAATLARHGVWVGNLSRVQIPIAGIRPFDRDSGCEAFRISGEQRIFT
jgi:hypothetical protein